MNKFQRIFISFLLALPLVVNAQNISVSSFKLLENDLTANTTGTMERDQNGEVAALIKVATTEQGFVFDGGMVGIVKTKQGVGEVWVYVPHGIKKITVQHPQLGVLRDYYFPTTIEKAKTYEMVLTTGKVETIVTHSVNKQFVVFNVTPSDAVVELNDEMLTVDGDGYAEKGLPFGTYNYRVSCANYHTEAGQVTLNAQGKAKVNVTLRPNFGYIKFDAANEYRGADIYINDERVGQVPYLTKELKSGTYKVKVMKSMYKTYEQEVVVSDNETVNLSVALHPNFGYIQLDAASSLYGADVYVNNEKVGRLPFKSQQLLSDTYRIKVVKSMYKSYEQQVKVTDNETIALNVELIPNFANVTLTTDAESEIWIDDNYKSKGRWSGPLELGEYSVEVKKKSHRTASEIVRVTEVGERAVALKAPTPIYASLELISTPSNATVALDGKYVGETPLILNNILVGDHTVTVTKQGFSKVEKTIELKEVPNRISLSLNNLGKIEDAIEYYQEGNYAEAIKIFRQLAEEEDNAEALYYLGLCFDDALGVSEDDKLAVEYYTKAAERGLAKAQNTLGYCWNFGEGVDEVNYEKAVEWYRKAAEQGFPKAQTNLGRCYIYGEGVPIDHRKAFELFRKAAEKGYPTAIYNLALCYCKGDGVAQDLNEAKRLCLIAIEKKVDGAEELLEEINKAREM